MPTRLFVPLAGPRPQSAFQHAAGLRALVLRWIEAVDPELSRTLHEVNQPKPYTLSPLEEWEGNPGFEVSLVADWLLEPVVAGMAACGPEIRLGLQCFRMAPPQTRASADWDELGAPSPALAWEFRLLSPTAHHAPGPYRKSVVLPSPELYFGTWLNRWNLCCSDTIPGSLMETAREQVGVAACTGEARSIRLDGRQKFIGFEGTVRFEALKPEGFPAPERLALCALARLVPFCGTGVETGRGMGQTELISKLR